MIKRLIHLADVHLRVLKYHDEYREVLINLINQSKELVKDYNREEIRIVIAGDLVHNKVTISSELLMIGTWFLRELAQIAPVITIAGNHDLLEGNLSRLDTISPMVSLLSDSDIKYFKESKCIIDDNIVWCTYSIFEENKRPDIESARKEFGNDKTYVGLFHAPIIGAKTNLGYEFENGATLDIFESLDFALLGDIHKLSSFEHNEIKIAYPGSVLQQDHGESIKNHGFLLWDVQAKTFEFHEVENPYGFYSFKIKSLNDIENDKEILTNP